MKTQLPTYLNFLGITFQGDIDGITCYRSKTGAVIWFPRAPPKCPATDLQNQLRDKWKAIINDWTELSALARANWNLVCDRASLSLHGLNLYIWWRCSQDDSIIQTLERQTGVTVL